MHLALMFMFSDVSIQLSGYPVASV